MTTDQPLTLTVEQAAEILGVARSTAYELVRSGDIDSLRLRRRIVVPAKALADKLAISIVDVWAALAPAQSQPATQQSARPARRQEPLGQTTLFGDH